MTTMQQEQFTTTTSDRKVESALIVESTRDSAGRYVELEISTSHRAGRGYSSSITRAFVDGYSRRVSLSFNGSGDVNSIDISAVAPTSTRFNQNALQKLHVALMDQIETELGTWITWAEQQSVLASEHNN